MIKIKYKKLHCDKVLETSLEPNGFDISSEEKLLDYVSLQLRLSEIPYTWFKIIT